jgi:hypothetical protein
MTNPITPPPELVQQWDIEARHQDYCTVASHIATRAAQWGADHELEACCEWLSGCGCESYGRELRAARRPKPPSLKEQALALIDDCTDPEGDYLDDNALSIIRRALEALPDD